jgi:hypothetical protein
MGFPLDTWNFRMRFYIMARRWSVREFVSDQHAIFGLPLDRALRSPAFTHVPKSAPAQT